MHLLLMTKSFPYFLSFIPWHILQRIYSKRPLSESVLSSTAIAGIEFAKNKAVLSDVTLNV